jgi:hypothetical protein
MTTFTVSLLSPEKKARTFSDATVVTANTKAGQISVYAHHMPLLTQVVPSTLIIKREKEAPYEYAHTGGVLVVEKNALLFFEGQEKQAVPVTSKPKGISAEEITRQMVDEFITRLNAKERISSA